VLKIKQQILPDVSNVAGYDNSYPPKIENINLMFYTLKSTYWVFGIADWGLYNHIDYQSSYKYYLGRRIIVEAPPGIKADILLIMKAIHDDCLILTNDTFWDHMNIQ